MPPALVVQVIDRIERRASRDFEDVHEMARPIVPQMRSWAANEGFELPKDWKVQLALGVKERLLANPDRHVYQAHLDRWIDLLARFS